MNTLSQEIDRIKSSLADISCKTLYGKTCKEKIQEILEKPIDNQ